MGAKFDADLVCATSDFIQQRFCMFQISGIESFGEPFRDLRSANLRRIRRLREIGLVRKDIDARVSDAAHDGPADTIILRLWLGQTLQFVYQLVAA